MQVVCKEKESTSRDATEKERGAALLEPCSKARNKRCFGQGRAGLAMMKANNTKQTAKGLQRGRQGGRIGLTPSLVSLPIDASQGHVRSLPSLTAAPKKVTVNFVSVCPRCLRPSTVLISVYVCRFSWIFIYRFVWRWTVCCGAICDHAGRADELASSQQHDTRWRARAR